MKIKGIELIQFMDEAWPGGDSGDWYWDHEEFEDNPDPDVTYDTDCLGGVYYQGDNPNQDPLEYDLGKLIRFWRNTRNKTAYMVHVPNEFVEAFEAYCKENNITITKG